VIWLLGGYMWLFVHRPFEVWPVLGALQVERASMAVVLTGWLLTGEFRWVRNPLNLAFVAFAIAIFLGWQESGRPDLGEKPVSDWFKIALFYLIVVSTIRDERDLKRLAIMYVATIAAYMAHSLWEYRNGRYQWTMGTVRLLGIDLTNVDPNTFAATILYSMPIALALWPQAAKAWQHALLAGYAILSLACILLTSSRSAFVGVCFLGVVVALASKHRLKLVLFMAVCAPFAWQALPLDRQMRFLTLIDPSYGPENARESAEGRSKGFHDGLRLWVEHPVFGVGPGAFGVSTGTGFEAHHLYGQVLGELGTVGLVAFGWVVCAFISNALAAHRMGVQQPDLKGDFSFALVRATSLTVVLLLLMGLGGHNLYRYTWLWFGAFQAVAMHQLRRREQELDARRQNAKR